MRLLFIKLKHIGDALLLTPTLVAVRERHPASEIWVVVRKGSEGILAGCPAIDRILTTSAPEAGNRRWNEWIRGINLVRQLRRQRFDYAFELSDGDRGRWLAWLSGARERVATRVYTHITWIARRAITRFSDTNWLSGHRAEKDFQLADEVLALGQPTPALIFREERTGVWPPAGLLSDFVVLHPGTRWKRKRWPFANWVVLGRHLQKKGLTVVISTGPDREEREEAARLQAELGAGTLNTDGETNWAQLAGLLHRAKLFVGVDTAAMHLAAACQCPTVAIFGPSMVKFWHPWRVPYRIVSTPEASAAQNAPDALDIVPQLSCDGVAAHEVIDAAEELLAAKPVAASTTVF